MVKHKILSNVWRSRSPRIREYGFQESGKFLLAEVEYLWREIQYLEPGIHSVESRIVVSPTWGDPGQF